MKSRLRIAPFLVFAALVVGIACGRTTPSPQATEVVGRTQEAVSAAASTFVLSYPLGSSVTTAVVAADDSLQIGDQCHILTATGSPGPATNAGSNATTIGNSTVVGALSSVGSVQLRDRASVSTVTSAGSVTLGNGDVLGAVVRGATLTPLSQRTMTVQPPAGSGANMTFAVGQVGSLPPALYGSVTVNPNAVVTLTAGTYLLTSLDLEPQAVLKLDTSGGAIWLYVNGAVIWRGSASGDTTRFALGYLATGTLDLESPFNGLALAPFGTLQLVSTSGTYTGAFYGKDVLLEAGVTVKQATTPFLLGGITVSTTTPCVGQAVKATVDSSGAGSAATTWINGVVGPNQYLQFSGAPGNRLVTATVFTPDGHADSITTPITLKSCAAPPGAAPPIALRFGPAPLSTPNVVEFSVRTYGANGFEFQPPTPATYVWTFGDGQTATTTAPLVQHDYSKAVNPLATYSYFTASVTTTTASGAASAQKIVPVWSLYAFNRSKGIVQPPNTLSIGSSSMTLSVTNYESTPLSITQASVELVPCDPGVPPQPAVAQAVAVTIPASSSGSVTVAMPSSIGADICNIGVHVTGSTAAGTVYSDAYARLKENQLLLQPVTNPQTVAILNQASALTPDPNSFTMADLRPLYAQGALAHLPQGTPPGTTYSGSDICGNSAPVNPSPNTPCCPGDTAALPGLTCQPTSGWVEDPAEFLNAYQGDFVMSHGCGYIGQLLHSLGQQFSHTVLMTKDRVEVQHSTANSDRITNSLNFANLGVNVTTGLAIPLLDQAILQNLYPGTGGEIPNSGAVGNQSYSVDDITVFYCLPDLAGGNGGTSGERNCDANGNCDCPSGTWRMGLEVSPDPVLCAGVDANPVPGLVIRPLPGAPASVLQGVRSVGGFASSINSHYRFFNYSRGDEQLPGTAWASSTISSVCSSFELLAAKAASLPLNTQGQQPTGVEDGMFPYTVETRTAAAQALYQQTYNTVSSQCFNMIDTGTVQWLTGSVGTALFGPLVGEVINGALQDDACGTAANLVANQINNCFANDSCADTGSEWLNPGAGIAVSPDDMLKWENYTNGGTYGYNEPIAYMQAAYRHAYAWTQSTGTGELTVTVVDSSGKPFPNADIIINGAPFGITDNSGVLSAPALAAGSYDVTAQFNPCGSSEPPDGSVCDAGPFIQGTVPTQVSAGGNQNVKIILCAGPSVNGGPPSNCPQVTSNPPLTVSLSESEVGPVFCFQESGFVPNAPVQITYGPNPFNAGAIVNTTADANGNLNDVDFRSYGEAGLTQFCDTGDLNGTTLVTITTFDEGANVILGTATVPAAFWCVQEPLGSGFNDGCVSPLTP
jgi:hypothetical protein